MADTLTIALDLRFVKRVGGSGKFGIITGTANISSYSTAKVPVSQITGEFKTTYRVVCDGVSSGGYAMRWDTAASAFRAYDTGAASGNALAEAVNATNVGAFNWVAFGLIQGAGG